MATAAQTAPRTADELLAMPDDGHRHELVAGALKTMTPASWRHGVICGRITALVGQHVAANDLGVVLTEATGFKLANDPDTVRSPDVSFLRKERVPSDDTGPAFFQGAPDLAVEVLSPEDTVFAVEQKVDEYLSTGCRLVWIVNPKLRRVTVHRSGAGPQLLHEQDMLDGEDVVPGFTCRVGDIFTWPV